jgi:zinc protease
MYRIPVASFLAAALLFTMVNLKAAPPESSASDFVSAEHGAKMDFAKRLTVIVQEDHSAPVASVQAWCATGSIDEDQHLGAGVVPHSGTHAVQRNKTQSANQIAQSIQDVGGYINAYTSFDRTVFWIDVPKDGVGTALEVLSDAMMNSTLPPEEYKKEQEVIRREFAMGMDDPDRMASLLLFGTAYQRHPYRFPVIGELEIYNQLTQEQVMQYYKTRYVPNNLTFVVVGDVDAEKVRQQLGDLFKSYPGNRLNRFSFLQNRHNLAGEKSTGNFPQS